MVMRAKALIAQGANVNATEPTRGQTPLMVAAANRRAEVVRIEVQEGRRPVLEAVVCRWQLDSLLEDRSRGEAGLSGK